ncbi:hypothetical protein ACLOJK_019151 [Asimina triloba]
MDPVMATLRISPQASAKEIKDWILSIDANKDGVITQQELEQALRGLNLWYTSWRSRYAVSSVDRNDNGAIDTDEEINELYKFAQQHWSELIRAT